LDRRQRLGRPGLIITILLICNVDSDVIHSHALKIKWECNSTVRQQFIDFKKTYDSVGGGGSIVQYSQ
jgi:hypothetical protein